MSKTTVLARKLLLITALSLALYVASQSIATPAKAHPGGTDSDGGHYCWTNCSYWGEVYGGYHYHNEGTGAGYEESEEEALEESDSEDTTNDSTELSEEEESEADKDETATIESTSQDQPEDEDDSVWWILGGGALLFWVGYAINERD